LKLSLDDDNQAWASVGVSLPWCLSFLIKWNSVIRKARKDGVRIGDVEGGRVVEMFATVLTWSFLHPGSLELRVAVEVWYLPARLKNWCLRCKRCTPQLSATYRAPHFSSALRVCTHVAVKAGVADPSSSSRVHRSPLQEETFHGFGV